MKRLLVVMAVMGLVVCLGGGQSWGDDGFYVIAAGGQSGKVLKTQVFTSNSQNTTVGDVNWAKLLNPQWTYTKLSSTSYLVITYQDYLSRIGAADALSIYQLRVNDQTSVAGEHAAMLVCNTAVPSANYGATGVWSNVPKGAAGLSVWHYQLGCSQCIQNSGANTTSVIVMEIEK